mmetsp:Transcript_85551/g.198856  ORF Transcript_85551/g.198856 Transcript_85551/m.198856 type:complete len:111 (+) Transcript_85551:2-334(+)
MVKEFGALALAAAMNVRQLLSVLLSYWLYGHALAPLQAVGLVLVFAPLLGKYTWRLLRREKPPFVQADDVADVAPESGGDTGDTGKLSPKVGGGSRECANPTDEEPEPEK